MGGDREETGGAMGGGGNTNRLNVILSLIFSTGLKETFYNWKWPENLWNMIKTALRVKKEEQLWKWYIEKILKNNYFNVQCHSHNATHF